MKHIEMKAFHDTKAAPVATMELSDSGAIAAHMPKLAEEAGLGIFIKNDGNGMHTHENGVILIDKVLDRDCTLNN